MKCYNQFFLTFSTCGVPFVPRPNLFPYCSKVLQLKKNSNLAHYGMSQTGIKYSHSVSLWQWISCCSTLRGELFYQKQSNFVLRQDCWSVSQIVPPWSTDVIVLPGLVHKEEWQTRIPSLLAPQRLWLHPRTSFSRFWKQHLQLVYALSHAGTQQYNTSECHEQKWLW